MRNCVWTPRLGNDGKNAKNKIFFENLNGRLALEDGSDWRETLGKRVSDDLEHFIFQRRKLWENAFRMIWNISFFDAEKQKWQKQLKIFAGQFLFSRNWRFGGARQV